MAKTRRSKRAIEQEKKLKEAITILKALGFAPKQCNDTAGYTLLALLDIKPQQSWQEASTPLRGITPIIQFISVEFDIHYAPNTRETVRDEAVKFFVESGMLLRNPDDPGRPTNSGKTVYQVEPHAFELFQSFKSPAWEKNLSAYLQSRESIRNELLRARSLARIPVQLPTGHSVTISPGGQNPLIKAIIEEFCPRFIQGGTVVYIGDAENKFLHYEHEYLLRLGVILPASAKMPDVVIHDTVRKWLVLVEAVTSAGPVDGKRRKELKRLFSGFKTGLVFVTAFHCRESMRSFLTTIS